MTIQQEHDLFTVFNDGVDKIVESFRGCEEKLAEIEQIECTKESKINEVKAQCQEKREDIERRCTEKDEERKRIDEEKSEAERKIKDKMNEEIGQATAEIQSETDQVNSTQEQQESDRLRLERELACCQEELGELKAGGAVDSEVSAQEHEVKKCKEKLEDLEKKLNAAKAQAEKIRGGLQ